jgi:hypothetical protein
LRHGDNPPLPLQEREEKLTEYEAPEVASLKDNDHAPNAALDFSGRRSITCAEFGLTVINSEGRKKRETPLGKIRWICVILMKF